MLELRLRERGTFISSTTEQARHRTVRRAALEGVLLNGVEDDTKHTRYLTRKFCIPKNYPLDLKRTAYVSVPFNEVSEISVC